MEQVNHPAAYFKRTSGTAVSLSRPQKRSVESTTVSLDGNLIAVSEIGLRFAHSPLFFSLSPFQWCRFSRVSVTMDSPLCHLFHVSGSQGQPAGLIFFSHQVGNTVRWWCTRRRTPAPPIGSALLVSKLRASSDHGRSFRTFERQVPCRCAPAASRLRRRYGMLRIRATPTYHIHTGSV